MAVKESEKTYIECRIFILGDRNVGKKSFINRLLNLPSTSDIRDFEAEKEFNKKIEELTKKIEEEEEFIRQSEEEKSRHFKNKNDSVTLGNTSSMNKKINQISESKDKTNSQINGKEITEKPYYDDTSAPAPQNNLNQNHKNLILFQS